MGWRSAVDRRRHGNDSSHCVHHAAADPLGWRVAAQLCAAAVCLDAGGCSARSGGAPAQAARSAFVFFVVVLSFSLLPVCFLCWFVARLGDLHGRASERRARSQREHEGNGMRLLQAHLHTEIDA